MKKVQASLADDAYLKESSLIEPTDEQVMAKNAENEHFGNDYSPSEISQA